MSAIHVQMPVGHSPQKIKRPEIIIELTAREFGVEVSDLHRKSRKRIYREPRQVSMFLLNRLTSLSLKQIGEMFGGGYDHTTVIHSRTQIQDYIDTEEDFRRRVDALTQQVFYVDSNFRPAVYTKTIG